MMKVLLAGATGYLGSYIAKELGKRDYFVRVIARNEDRFRQQGVEVSEVRVAELTQPDSIQGCCQEIDVVISTVGITRQKDGLTYMDVDYQANLNLLEEAKQSGVRKFIYVSVLNGEKLRDVKICQAKERFVDQLKRSDLETCIIRPNGFFSDMSEFMAMARRGRIYLFGKGQWQANPIHGKDLAVVCVDAIGTSETDIEVGGPEILTQNEIVGLAFEALGKRPKVTHIPDWMRVGILKGIRLLTSSKVYGPIEFFLAVMARDMVAPKYGRYRLGDYFRNLSRGQA